MPTQERDSQEILAPAAEPGAGTSVEVICPFCGSNRNRLVSAFGCQMLTDQRQCLACRTYFEAVRNDR